MEGHFLANHADHASDLHIQQLRVAIREMALAKVAASEDVSDKAKYQAVANRVARGEIGGQEEMTLFGETATVLMRMLNVRSPEANGALLSCGREDSRYTCYTVYSFTLLRMNSQKCTTTSTKNTSRTTSL